MGRIALVLAVVFALFPALAPLASACLGPPCGSIYPSITIAVAEGTPTLFEVKVGQPVDVQATVSYRFDAAGDGYTAVPPTDPVKISFEFPRKPAWADIKVEPDNFEVPVDNPTYFAPPDNPQQPTLFYTYTQKVTIHFVVTGQAVFRDGYDYAKLLVFAKSSESGLYKAGYGIKELRVAPEGAVHESDLAGSVEKFTAVPLPKLSFSPLAATFGGQGVTITPPKDPVFWESQAWNVKLAPAPAGRMTIAVFDEKGGLESIKGPIDSSGGSADVNVTLASPGLHTFTVTLLPSAGGKTPPMTYALDLVAGDLSAQGYQYPKTYVVSSSAGVPLPTGNTNPPLPGSTADATIQWERDIPFFCFDSAQSVSALATLLTPSGDALGRGLANVQISILDPDGNSIAQTSIDPYTSQKPLRVGSVPSEGWYTFRLRGAGLPAGSAYDARVEVDYAQVPQVKNRADGVADVTPGLSARAGRNLTLPTAGLTVWQPGEFTPRLEKVDAAMYQTTVTANGSLVYASGLRAGKAGFTPPHDGRFRAFVYAEPGVGAPFAPDARAFTFDVGDGRPVVAQKFPIADAPAVPTSADETLLALYAIPVLEAGAHGAGTLANGRVEIVDAAGKTVEPSAPGTYYARALATNAGPATVAPLKYDLDLSKPVTIEPTQGSAPTTQTGLPIPGFAVGILVGAVGAVAVSIALLRRT